EKIIEYHSLNYLKKVTKIPLDFNTLQNLIINNPIYLGKTIVAFRKSENRILISTVDTHFKNLLTLSANDYLMERNKLNNLNVTLNQTKDLTYSDYENNPNFSFSTLREITITEKTKIDIQLNFKQYDFNKELSFPFNIPKSYKTK